MQQGRTMAAADREAWVGIGDSPAREEDRAMARMGPIDQAIREQSGAHRTPVDRFRVRAARSTAELVQAFSLLHEAYVGAHLQQNDDKNMRITAQHVLRESVVFVAWEDDQPAGTVTVTLDSPAGLPLDKDFPEEMKQIRKRARRVAEVGSLAVRQPWRSSGLNVLLGFVCGWAIRRLFGASHAVIGVNPAHVGLYRAVFDFAPFSRPQQHADLQAPVVGLMLDMGTYPNFLRTHFDEPLENGRLVADEFCGIQPPSSVEVAGALLQRDEHLWKIPRRAFQEVFIRRSKHLYALDSQTRTYLESQRTVQTLAHEALID